MGKKKILFVSEDENRELLIEVYNQSDEFEFIELNDPKQVGDVLEREKIDCIICDAIFHMSGFNFGAGIIVYKMIKALPRENQIPVIIRSGLDYGDLLNMLKMDLSKVDPSDIIDSVIQTSRLFNILNLKINSFLHQKQSN